MSRVGADPDDLLGMRDDLAQAAREIEDVGRDVGRSLSAFVASSSEYVPGIPAHAAAIASLGLAVDGLGQEAVVAARRLVAADGRLFPTWLPGVDPTGRFRPTASGTTGAIFQVSDGWDAAVVLGTTGSMGTAHGRLALLQHRWGAGPTISMPRYRDITNNPVGVANNKTLRPLKHQQELRNAALRTDLDDVLARGRTRFESVSLSRAGIADDLAAAATRGSRAAGVARLGNRALGPLGAAWSVKDSVLHARDGEWVDAGADAASAVGGIMMMSGFPPAQIAGAVLTVGALAYDHRETLGRVAGSVGRRASSLAEGAGRWVKGLF